MENKPLIIFDTDMDTDCDDAGALAMLLHAHTQNKIELLGMIADSANRYAAPCCEAIAKSYGVSVSVGAIYADECTGERFEAYLAHSKSCAEKGMDYNRVFAEEIGKIDRDYESAVTVYRKLLANAKEKSVTVLCVGMLTAISAVLQYEADEISPLSGIAMFKQKVEKVITMGNPEKIPDFNWGMDAVATEIFFRLCPVPIYISAEGREVITGEHLSKALPETNLVRRAYEQWLGKPDCGRASWDLIASLFAINPKTQYLTATPLGDCVYDVQNKITQVVQSKNPKCNKLHLNCTNQMMEDFLNGCMLGK
ncbi:MAG: nucleoside hydrolase [Clostridia bacterium]|nr:nucleoside hydrolase [Clostridia bacterium]